MFLDQIIQPDSAFFKTWDEIKSSAPNNKGPVPLWYKHMIDQYTINPNTLRLNFDLPHLLQQQLRIKRPKKNFTSPNQTLCPCNTWTYFWSPVIKDIVYSKILSKDNHSPNSPMMIIEYWIPKPASLLPNPNNDNTPKSHDNILHPCERCNLYYPYYIADLRPKCIILQALDKSLDLKIKPKGTLPNNQITSTTRTSSKGKLCQTTKAITLYKR
ncbi:hypothetical protein RclHR1_02990010 [Rhizophagus clarus]|nr:hypothetical protein RclHR1_02990010 [Rhizophagus clarus]